MNFAIYGWCVLGIVISVVLPILWTTVYRYFPKPTAQPAAVGPLVSSLWKAIMPYLVLGLASCITALLIVAISGSELTDYRAAILAGYAWDSTLQKFRA